MTDLTTIPLTPAQHAELETLDPDHVNAWINAYAIAPATIKNPVGWFLNGVRSGNPPFQPSAALDAQTEQRADRYIRNAGYLLDRQSELEDELYGDHGILRHSTDPALRQRLLELYRTLRPKGIQVEEDFLARAARHRQTRAPRPAPTTAPPDPTAEFGASSPADPDDEERWSALLESEPEFAEEPA